MRRRQADGALPRRSVFHLKRAQGRGFGEAVAFPRGAAGERFESLQYIHRQWRPAGDPHRHRGEVEILDLGMIDQSRVHGRHRRNHGDLFEGDVGEHPVRIEADVHHHLRTGGDSDHHEEGQAEDVEQRQDRQRLLRFFIGAEAVPVRVDIEHRAKVGVREHRPLRLAGGAAGILQHRDLVLERAVRVARERAVIGDQICG